MIRLLVIAAVIALGCKLALGKWPWEFLSARTSTHQQALRHARQLLGVSAEASRQEVLDAHRRLVASVHPDRGGTNAQVHEANAARDLLIGQIPPSI
ncbi:molecular chaperone DnaJ [Allopontixanthobacter sp.]|uniref:molecular chaperone DnaJ n=1 Tax=Allopontixanthobacter sp. TaxID=2906452 RepID=UPI002AB8E910|nr:molecular chaperone DnaJ [Allopontixanthobacter sp.]MDZ4308877.1 molecular chaperone DnaJ [Allopontixanthobacter sp.]